ncbi:hypothetical protein MBLNU459_g8220t1 [Dothideomycetes sp. NU459]
MSLPSSPPSLPEEIFNDPPSSPPLPPAQFPTRKRHADYESSLSSDPIFSEDASEESEYSGAKKKRHYKGPWFRLPAVRREIGAKSGTRNQDSGVWMGSDSSDSSIGSGRMQALSFQDFMVKRAPPRARESPRKSKKPTAEQLAAEVVGRALDACQQTVDLSDMRLAALPNDVVRPLQQLIRYPLDMNNAQKMTPDHYAPLTSEIKLFLANNELGSLPSELWNLGNIAVLSLRNNNLTDLSPSIGRLRNLQELNIAGNQIRFLPWELLGLMSAEDRKLVRLSVSPNPLMQPLGKPPPTMLARPRIPSSAQECLRAIHQLRTRCPLAAASSSSYEALLIRLFRHRLRDCLRDAELTHSHVSNSPAPKSAQSPPDTRPLYAASSVATFFEVDGSPLRSATSSFSMSQPEPDFTASLAVQSLPARTGSSAPSLFELSARACARSPYLGQLGSLLPDEPSPPVDRALDRAIRSKEEGLRTCSVCRKQYLIARAQWMEFWYNGTASSEPFLPFLRHSCSWACVGRLWAERDDELVVVEDELSMAGTYPI